jgi:hypothetical protein
MLLPSQDDVPSRSEGWQYAKVAQSVEHAPEKCGVARSIRALGTKMRRGPVHPGLSSRLRTGRGVPPRWHGGMLSSNSWPGSVCGIAENAGLRRRF